MGRLNIREKMGLLALLVAAGLITLIILNYLSLTSLSRLEAVRLEAAELNSDMLMLRRHEKDFIARKDLKYAEKFESSFAVMEERIVEVKGDMDSFGIEIEEIGEFQAVLLSYKENFHALVEQQQAIGLHPKDGLYGALRDKVHQIETLITGYEKEHGVTRDTHSLMRTMLMLRRHEKDFMLRGDLEYLAKFTKRIQILQQKLQTSVLDNGFESQTLIALKGYQGNFFALVKAQERFGISNKEGILGEMRETIHKSESLLDELNERVALFSEEHIQLEETVNMVTGIILAALIIGLLVAISQGITRRITNLSAVMSQASHNKDLSIRVTADGGDEIASMASIYNEMMEEFDGLMREVHASSVELSAAAEQLKSSTSLTAEGVNRQLIESEQVATAMNEMNATVSEVANNASQAAAASSLADEASNMGSQRVEANLKSFTQLAANIENSGSIIENLSEESNNIGAMLNVIRGIAEQTNLLALNAAIEAARAGEQGRGFAVVADEVRTLAQRSAQSTQEIEEVVNRLQKLAADAVTAMQQGKTQVDESVQNSSNVAKALNEIKNSIETVNSMNIQIATAAEEQTNVSEEINRSVVSITEVARETSQLTETIASAGDQLQSLSEQLGERVSRFKLS